MKNYTSLQKMKASEVVASFTEEKVTQETFKTEVKKGTLYKGFEVPKNAKMLKFRYYSPNGTLIEQNNVPFVYDGTGIQSVKNYYLLTDSSSGITLESEGWQEEVQTVTAQKRFLWTYTKTTYTNKAYTCTEPCISAVFGEQGERGAMYLGHYTDAQAAYEANTPAVFTGDYYLNTTDSFLYVFNKEENLWTKIEDLNDYRYNQSINDIFAAIENSTDVENFIKAKKIWVQHLSAAIARVNQLYSNIITLATGKDLDGNTTGGIIKSSNYNGTIQNGKITKEGSAGWAIDHSGKAEFQDGTFRGTFNGLFIEATEYIAYIDFQKQETAGIFADKGSFSIGNNAKARGGSIVIGSNSTSSGKFSTVLGKQNSNTGENSILIGKNLSNKKGWIVCIGNDNTTEQSSSISIGNTIINEGDSSITIGNQSKTKEYKDSENNTIAASGAIALGAEAETKGYGSIAIGRQAKASVEKSIAIGDLATTTLKNEINIGNQFRIVYFAAGTKESFIYNYFISHFPNRKWQSEMNSVESCVMGYYGSFCIGFIKNDYDNNLDFYNPQGNARRLTVEKDSSTKIPYPLKIGFLHID